MKFTDEELSKILTAHSNKGLYRGGYLSKLGYPGCIIQIAKETDRVFSQPSDNFIYTNRKNWEDIALWFDSNYHFFWTEEEFLKELNKLGVI